VSALTSLRRTLAAPVPPELRHQLWLTARAAPAALHFRKIPDQPLNRLLEGVDEAPLTIQHRFRPRALPYGEAYVLSLICAHVQPQRIFELGTAGGEGTLLLLRQAPDARVDTLDLGEGAQSSLGIQPGDAPLAESSVGAAFRDTELSARITQHLGDSARFDYTPFAGIMDLIFIDGAHTYDYALADSRAALGMVAAGGVVVWDDCHLRHAGVPRALAQLREEGYDIVRVTGTRLALLRMR